MGCKKHHDKFDHDGQHHFSGNCVCEVVRAIRDIQDARKEEDCRDCTDCLTEALGDLDGPRRRNADTRVFTLTTKKGKPFFAFFTPEEMNDMNDKKGGNNGKGGKEEKNDDVGCVSIFFRVEDVFDSCCARLRVLQPLDEDFEPVKLEDECGINLEQVCLVQEFARTRSCVTVDLNDFLAVQCIKDVDLDICD